MTPIKNIMTFLSDICEYYSAYTKNSFWFFFLLCFLDFDNLGFSQNKPSHYFLRNLWFLVVCKIVEHRSASAHL